MPKGTPLHRALGYLFVALMLATVTSSFFVREPGGGFAIGHLFIPAAVAAPTTIAEFAHYCDCCRA